MTRANAAGSCDRSGSYGWVVDQSMAGFSGPSMHLGNTETVDDRRLRHAVGVNVTVIVSGLTLEGFATVTAPPRAVTT